MGSRLGFFLDQSVGNRQMNKGSDVRGVKKGLRDLGYYQSENDNDYITQELDQSIKAFQQDHKLKVDGILKPDGETEQTLRSQIIAQPKTKQSTLPPEVINGGILGQSRQRQPHPNLRKGGILDTIYTAATTPTTTTPSPKHQLLSFGVPASPNTTDATGKTIRMASADKPKTEAETETSPPLPKRKPEIIAPTEKGNALLDFIGGLESSDNYNIIAGGQEAPLTTMTIEEVQDLQKELEQKGAASTALGRYQIKDTTLDFLVEKMNLDNDKIFDEKLQDQMGRELLDHRGYEKYRSGEISTKDFIRRLSKEWAAFPKDETNKSYYGDVGNNKALTDFETIKDLLER